MHTFLPLKGAGGSSTFNFQFSTFNMTLSIIVAIAKNFAIGKKNELLYHMPNDMKRFKETTTGHTVIMGKNTFASFPRRPLPNRRNIVLALPHEVPEDREGAEWVCSLQEALDLCKDEEEVFIIGIAVSVPA